MSLAATVKETKSAPLPLAPAVIVIQLSLLEADHSQPSGELTLVLLLPPSESKEATLGACRTFGVSPLFSTTVIF